MPGAAGTQESGGQTATRGEGSVEPTLAQQIIEQHIRASQNRHRFAAVASLTTGRSVAALYAVALTIALAAVAAWSLSLGGGRPVQQQGTSQPIARTRSFHNGTDVVGAVDDDCVLQTRLAEGDSNDSVLCLESHLREQGFFEGQPDANFDAQTALAVEHFQAANDLVVDGIVGPQTGARLAAWAGPDRLPPDPSTCPGTGHAAVIDRFNQRAWLCDGNRITRVMPVTTSAAQPDPGTYKVFDREMNATSDLTGRTSTMTHFVVFASGRYTGARVGFHSIPKYSDGSFVQSLDSVGSPDLFGESSGCIRARPDDATEIWDWLDDGDEVVVVS